MKLYNYILALCGICFISTTTTTLHGYELDWAEQNWTASTNKEQSDEFTNVDGSDIDVSISIVTSGINQFASETSINPNGEMILGVDYSNRDRRNNFVDVFIRFSAPVVNISLRINDVDNGAWYSYEPTWEDVIENIQGSYDNQFVAASVTHGSGITADPNADPNETIYRGNSRQTWNAQSQITMTWDNPVDSIGFRWSGGNLSREDPGYQVIGMGGVTFYSAVPEPSTYLFGFMGFTTIGVSFFRRRFRRMKSGQSIEVRSNDVNEQKRLTS